MKSGRVSGAAAALAAAVAIAAGPATAADAPGYALVTSLRQQSPDADANAAAARFHAGLVAELRKVPGITVRVADAATVLPLRDGEYYLSVSSLETSLTSTGLTSYRTSAGQGAFNGQGFGDPWPVELRLDRGSWTGPARLLVTPVKLAREGGSPPPVCARELVAERTDACLPMAQLVADQAEMLRTQYLPFDAVMRQALLSRVADAALPEHRRTAALAKLMSAAKRSGEAALDDAAADAALKLVRELPSARATVWRQLRQDSHPALVAPLLASLGSATDESTRETALVALLGNHREAPQVRNALQQAAREDSSARLRALARYGTEGAEAWRTYVRDTLADTTLPPEARVRPLVYSSDDAPPTFAAAVLPVLAEDPAIVAAVLALGREFKLETDSRRRGPVRRALYALTRSEAGAVQPGTPRADVEFLYREYSPALEQLVTPPGWTGLAPESR